MVTSSTNAHERPPSARNQPTNSVQLLVVAITTIVAGEILFAVVGLGKLYDPGVKVLVGVGPGLAMALSTVSAVTWMT